MEEAVFYHKKSKTVIIGDLIQRHPEEHMKGWKGLLMRMDGLVGKQGSTPKEWRWTFLPGGKKKARAALDKIIEEWKPEKMIIAHGHCILNSDEGTAVDMIAQALSWI